MKNLAIVGGIAPGSTIDYYRLLIERFRQRSEGDHYPHIIINSIPLDPIRDAFFRNDYQAAADILVDALNTLASAGADIAILAANTAHYVFDDVRARSPIPLISIVEASCTEARERNLSRLAILGTRFTMQGAFYPDVFSRANIQLIPPDPKDLAWVDDKYFNELVENQFLPDTRQGLLDVIDRIKDAHNIDGVLLAGTELSLILTQDTHNSLPLLHTTNIHVEKIVDQLLA